MDTDKLKSRIREALGAAGIPREISEQIDQIVDSVAGKKDEEKNEAKLAAHQQDQARRVAKDEEEDDDDAPVAASAKMAVKPARKTKTARKKK
jgi:hypothetical protein